VNADVQRVREWLESQPFELRMVPALFGSLSRHERT
jgi:hypothetical protein